LIGLACLLFSGSTALAQTNAQVPQGGTAQAYFTDAAERPGDAPDGFTILDPSGAVVASGDAPNGWYCNARYGQISAPASAPLGTGYSAHNWTAFRDNDNTGYNLSATFDVVASAVSLTGLSISPPSVTGGASATGTLTLSGPAPANGLTISLVSDNAAANVPASVPIGAGATGTTFSVTTTAVASSVTANITAAYNGVSKSAALTVNAPPVFQIIGINNGDTISGDVSVEVNAYTETGLLTLAVDGVDFGTHNISANPNPNTATFSLETSAYSNGTHVIKVRDPYGNTDTRTVTFSNTLSNLNYNPMFDSTAGVTDIANACHITGAFSTPQSWTVSITDDSNNPVNSFSGTGTVVDVTWNGANSRGQMMPGDDYLVTITGSGTASQSSSATGVTPNAASSTSKTFLVNKDNYADSIILIQTEGMGAGGDPGEPGVDTPAMHRAKAIAFKHFLHGELDRFVGSSFNYPILVSLLSDSDFAHDPKLIGRIENKFRRPALFVYVSTDGEYHNFEVPGVTQDTRYKDIPLVHPYFELGSHYWYSAFTPGQPLTSKDIDISALTANVGYGVSGNGPLVWIDTCFATAGGGKIGPDYTSVDLSFGNNPVDYQWANDFSIDNNGFSGGVYFGSVAEVPRQYLNSDQDGYDWSYWRQNLLDFLCAGGNNFQTALNRSYDIQSFTSSPTPPQVLLWVGYGNFAF